MRVTTRRFPWWIVLAIGVLIVAVGVSLMFWPIAPVWLLVIIFGVSLIANGLAMFVRPGATAGGVILGALLIVAGVLSLVFMEFTAQTFVTFVAVSLIVLGAFWAAASIRAAGGLSGFVIAPAAFLLIAGILTLVWPDFVLTVIAMVGGVLMLVLGISLIVGAFQLRKLRFTTREARFL